jgi:transcriptional regulator with XRE-family HTH domain
VAATDFPKYLQRAMDAAGLPTAADVARAADRAGIDLDQNLVSRWLRGESKGAPTVAKLRPVARVLGIPLNEMMVHAGLVEPSEVGLKAAGPPVTAEDKIRADPRLTPDKQNVLIQLLETLREGHSSRTGVRDKRYDGAPDQPVDMDVTEELSG